MAGISSGHGGFDEGDATEGRTTPPGSPSTSFKGPGVKGSSASKVGFKEPATEKGVRKMSIMERLNPFSKKTQKIAQSNHAGGPSICFDVIKTNQHGKKQQRKLHISAGGVSNMDGSKVKWFLPADDCGGVDPEPTGNPKQFRLATLTKYQFEADSPDQLKRIFEAFRMLGLVGNNVEEDEDEEQGLNVDDFSLLKVIGKGSFGKVFQVQKKDTGKIYAMKVLKKAELVKRNQVEHTKTEKSILASIDHPFMVRLYYAFHNADKLYMVLDYVNGGELFFHLRKAGRFPEELARFYIAEVILAIDYLHSRDIIYRDLKPENILLDWEGHVKVTDFGLSKTEISSVGGKGEGTTAKTFCGTPEYLAPEIITGIGHGKAVDWWSVGILLYEMLTGAPPFYSANRNEMYLNAIKGDLEFPSYVSDEAKSILRGLLVRRPEERLGSGNNGGTEVKNHPFFRSINWGALFRRETPPPFKPRVKDEQMDTSNFDTQFTDEVPRDSMVVGEAPFDSVNKDPFEGFGFMPTGEKGGKKGKRRSRSSKGRKR